MFSLKFGPIYAMEVNILVPKLFLKLIKLKCNLWLTVPKGATPVTDSSTKGKYD